MLVFAVRISKLRRICRKIARYLQHSAASTRTLHGMMQHQFIARSFAIGEYLQQCKANIGKLHDSCKIWDHICKLCCDVHGALKQKNLYTVECSQFLETKNYHLRSMCSILVQILVHRIVFAIFATIIGKPHGMRSILKLTSVNWMLLLQLS